MQLLFLFLCCFLQGETRVYVDIVGDLFHAGHVAFFQKARQFGDQHGMLGIFLTSMLLVPEPSIPSLNALNNLRTRYPFGIGNGSKHA